MFKNYYKLPLQINEWGIDAKTADFRKAFDWLLDIKLETKQRIIAQINDPQPNGLKLKGKFSYDKDMVILYDNKPIILIRGWGMLTGIGGYNLPLNEAAKIQDAFATYIVECLNK